jgi:hypothetical protein
MDNSTKHQRTVSPVVPADCPEDGGKWAIYCEHVDADGEIIGTGVVQDSNKRRLAPWRNHTLDWCCYCQELRDFGTLDFFHDVHNPARVAVTK